MRVCTELGRRVRAIVRISERRGARRRARSGKCAARRPELHRTCDLRGHSLEEGGYQRPIIRPRSRSIRPALSRLIDRRKHDPARPHRSNRTCPENRSRSMDGTCDRYARRQLLRSNAQGSDLAMTSFAEEPTDERFLLASSTRPPDAPSTDRAPRDKAADRHSNRDLQEDSASR